MNTVHGWGSAPSAFGTPVNITGVTSFWGTASFNTTGAHGLSDGTYVRIVTANDKYDYDGYVCGIDSNSFYISLVLDSEVTEDFILYDANATGTATPITASGAIAWYQDSKICFCITDTAGACYKVQEDGMFKIKDSSNNTVFSISEAV